MFKNFPLKYSSLCCLWLSFAGLATAGCPIPKQGLENGELVYQKEEDRNLTTASEFYLLRLRCSPGYIRIGAKSMICISGRWSSKLPKCIRRQCPDPPTIQNGQYILTTGANGQITIDSVVKYSCNVGYEMENASMSSLVCVPGEDLNTVNWMGEVPTCVSKDECHDPGVSPDGRRTGNCCYAGDIVRFSCKDGYNLIGSNTIECLSGGSWSSLRPLCRPLDDHCDVHPAVPNGVVKGEKEGDYYLPYDEVQVLCEPGYKYSGSSEFVMCDVDSQWEEEFGECREFFCDPPEELENGSITELKSTNITEFSYKSTLTYVCDRSYRLIGSSWRTCDRDGWSGKTPKCEPVRCPDPGVPEYGFKKGDRFHIGDKVTFSCFSGFELLGSIERFCMPNGQWNGELAKCDLESNYCPNPGIPIKGMKNNSNYDMGQVVGFRCAPGYSLLGSHARECLPNRTWSGEEVRCLGPYDFDNTAQVGDILKKAMAEIEEKQKRDLEEYNREMLEASKNGRFLSRSLDINYPGRLIFYFIFDVSGSVELNNFKKSINFAKGLVKRVKISQNGARAGALTFSSKAEVQFFPLDYASTDEVLDALDKINYTGGGTYASSALRLVRTQLIPTVEGNLGKKDTKSVVFILTDGKANMGGDPQDEARELKDAGVEIYCIGVTGSGGVEKESLYNIASDPKGEHVFILQNYETLDYLMQEITDGKIDYSKCGLGHDELSLPSRSKIIGGLNAPEPWPWMAALYFLPRGSKDVDSAKLECGGSIISRNFILTAAHCMYRKDGPRRKEEEIIVKLGLTNVKNETKAQKFQVKKIYVHPSYQDGISFDFDIALLQLEENMEFTADVRPVCLPPVSSENTLYRRGERAVALGWGHPDSIDTNSNLPIRTVDDLKEVNIPIQDRQVCAQSVVDNSRRWMQWDNHRRSDFTDNMFCAGDGKGGNDTCKGDSGGPMMQPLMNEDGNTYWTEIGLVSWGYGCGRKDSYGFYTHVQMLLPWLSDTIGTAENEGTDEA